VSGIKGLLHAPTESVAGMCSSRVPSLGCQTHGCMVLVCDSAGMGFPPIQPYKTFKRHSLPGIGRCWLLISQLRFAALPVCCGVVQDGVKKHQVTFGLWNTVHISLAMSVEMGGISRAAAIGVHWHTSTSSH
jgi:hypothetical protein